MGAPEARAVGDPEACPVLTTGLHLILTFRDSISCLHEAVRIGGQIVGLEVPQYMGIVLDTQPPNRGSGYRDMLLTNHSKHQPLIYFNLSCLEQYFLHS